MRLALLVLALAACSRSASAGRTWPKQTPHDNDGGESLAPHASAKAIAAVAETDDERPAAREPEPIAPASAPAAAPAVAPPPPSDDDLPITEEIVIEVGD